MVSPWLAVAGPAFVMDMSDAATMVVDAFAVFITVPNAAATTLMVIAGVEAPPAKVAKLQVTVSPVCEQLAAGVTDEKVTPAGRVSTSWTELAVVVPLLVMPSEYANVLPRRAVAGADLVTATSVQAALKCGPGVEA